MNKFIALIVALFISMSTNAQVTNYYALTKKISGETQSTNVSGGQFISFLGDICYESNRKGVGVGHGTLQLNRNYSNAKFKLYMGKSYWGNNATFKFKSDLTVLNVVLENGDVYVYKKSTAPSSATTCSLIRKKERGGISADGVYNPIWPNKSSNGGFPSGSTAVNTEHEQTLPSRKQTTKHTCHLCNGSRRIVKDTYPPLYGSSDYQIKCGECGGTFMRSTGHTHITCPQCHGKGYYTIEN